MSSTAHTVAITGSRGYLGGLLRNQLAGNGWKTIDLVRKPQRENERLFVLGQAPNAALLQGVDALIHCAYDMTLRKKGDIWRTNVDGTERLLDLATSSGVHRTIVLSSMSAYEGTEQLYGQAKLDIERRSSERGWTSVRPGLVYGPQPEGMAGTLRKLAGLPLVPLIVPVSHQFTVHEDDFACAIAALLTSESSITTEPIGVANPTPVSFARILEFFAQELNRNARFIPVHWKLVKFVLETAEAMSLPIPMRSDSLMGLMRPASSVPNIEVIEELGISLRRFGEPSLEISARNE